MSHESGRDDASQITTDEETVRTWADAHDVAPFRHREEERYRLATPDRVDESHEQVEWEAFFTNLDERDYVVIFHGESSAEPFEVADREDAFSRSNVGRDELEDRLIEGQTVTSTVTETTVLEEVIVEEATIESELVDTEITDDQVVDVELRSRECTNCTLEDAEDFDEAAWFDEERYLSSVGTPSTLSGEPTPATETTTSAPATSEMTDVDEAYPYDASFDIEETWAVTRAFTERFTVESRVTDVDVGETESVRDRDVDVEGLQRNIVQSDLLDLDLSAEEVMTQCEIETQFHEDDRLETHFSRSHTVEDEIVDHRRVRADVTAATLGEVERTESRDVAAGLAEDETTMEEGTTTAAEREPGSASATTDETALPLSQDEIGKDVVDASGDTVGMVTDVSEEGTTLFVDAEPGLTERIKAALDWGDADENDYSVELDEIDHVSGDAVQLKSTEELDERARTA